MKINEFNKVICNECEKEMFMKCLCGVCGNKEEYNKNNRRDKNNILE